jgi:dipeptidyl aminopeptidase/acylaminoacyl peptidase
MIIWRSDSKGFIFRSNVDNKIDFKIYEYLIGNKDYELVVDAEGYLMPLDMNKDSTKVIYSIRPSSANQDLYLFDRNTKESKHLTEHDGHQRNQAFFGESDNELFLLTDDGGDFNKVYKYNVSTGVKTHLGRNIPWDISELRVSPCKRYISYTANREGYSDLHIVDSLTGNSLPSPASQGIISSASITDDHKVIYTYESPAEPSNIHIWDLEKEQSCQLTFSRFYGIDKSEFIQPELVKIESFDGLMVPAFLYLPEGYSKGRNIPMVTFIHGGPEGQSRPTFVTVYQQLLKMGIGVCLPNVRGSAGYGMHYQALDDYKLRMDSVKDGIAVGEWLIKEGYTSTDRLGVLGGSYGGFMCLSVIAEAPHLWAAAVDMVGVANLVTFLENTKPSRRKVREVEYGPLSDREFLKSISPIHKMDKVRTPLLVVHGRTDPRVPIGEAEQVVAVLEKGNQIVEPLFFDDEGHGIRKLENRITYYEKVFEFFTTHLNMEAY